MSTNASLLSLVIAVAIGTSPTVELKVTITGALIPLTSAIILPGLEAVIVVVGCPSASTKRSNILMSPTTPISSPCVVKAIISVSPEERAAVTSPAPLTLPG
jgi:hypothetical protein